MIAWAYVSSVLNLAAGLLLLPVILHYLSVDAVAVWFVFLTVGGLAQLLEMGLMPTLSRNVAYLYNGAYELTKNHMPKMSGKGKRNWGEINGLILAAKNIYAQISLVVFVLMVTLGSIYINTLEVTSIPKGDIFISWLVYATCASLNLYFNYANGVMQGRGDITSVNKMLALTKLAFILFGSLGLYWGFGLIGLSMGVFASTLIGRLLTVVYLKNKTVEKAIVEKKDVLRLRQILWHSSFRQGLVQLGAFFVLRGNLLVAAAYLDIKTVAQYGLAQNLFFIISGLSTVLFYTHLPQINALIANEHIVSAKKILLTSVGWSWVIYILGVIGVVLSGGYVLSAIGSKTELLNRYALLLLAVVMLLEMNHSLFATFLTAFNTIPFVFPALISGVAVLLSSVFLISYYGVFGLIAAQGIVQLAYNNWKWPRMAFNKCNSIC